MSDVTLYDIETTLVALTEVDPADLTPELRAQYEQELQEAIRKAPEKRERVAIKLFDLGQRAAVKRAAAQAHRQKGDELEQSAKALEHDADRLKEYVLNVMRELPKPARGVRTLEGTSATFKAKAVADSVEITDESMLSNEFKTATVTMPLWMWKSLCEIDTSESALECLIRLQPTFGRAPIADIKKALQRECSICHGKRTIPVAIDVPEFPLQGHTCSTENFLLNPCPACRIPGARLVTGKLRLEVS